jgi:uncharacterized protein YggE
MKILTIAQAATLFGTLLFGSAAAAQPAVPPQVPQVPQVIVTGEGVVKATPDRAWVTIGAESRSKVSTEAQQRNADAMTAIQQKLSGLGIPKDAIRTTAIDLQMEFDYTDGKQIPRGYVARNTIEVRVDDMAALGKILDAVVTSGATMIHGVRFDVKAREQLEAAALAAAVKEARGKAQAIAAAAGQSIDRVLRIEEQFVGRSPEPMNRGFAMAKAEAATPVAPGEIEIRMMVRLSASLR